MLSCRSRREDFFPVSRCKKIFQFLWILPRSALASAMCGVCVSRAAAGHAHPQLLLLHPSTWWTLGACTHWRKTSVVTDFVSSLFEGGKKSAISNSSNEISGCRPQKVWPSLSRVLFWFAHWVKNAAVLETAPSFRTQSTGAEREYPGCYAALFLYLISSFSGCTVSKVALVWGFLSSDCAVCAHDAPFLGPTQKKVGLRRGKEASEVPLIKYELLTALRPAFNFPRLLLESPF